MKTGRNDPCPCGSGKKHKHCCLGKDISFTDGTEKILPLDLGKIFTETACEGYNDEQELLDTVNARLIIESESANNAPLDHFHGISPNQMTAILYAPFDSPGVLSLKSTLALEPVSTAALLLNQLLMAMADGPIKSTAKGNLPVSVVRSIADQSEEIINQQPEFAYIESIRREEDFHLLHKTRLVSDLAGLIVLRNKKFQISGKCAKLMKKDGLKSIYPEFLKAYIKKFNWGYEDLYGEVAIVQMSVFFTLYLLRRYAARKNTTSFYADAFLQAFPAALNSVKERQYSTKEELCRRCYCVRMLECFCHYCGFIELHSLPGKSKIDKLYNVTTTPLLNDWVQAIG